MDYFHFGLPSVLSSIYGREVFASLRITRSLICAWCLLSTMEWVSNLDLFREGGIVFLAYSIAASRIAFRRNLDRVSILGHLDSLGTRHQDSGRSRLDTDG